MGSGNETKFDGKSNSGRQLHPALAPPIVVFYPDHRQEQARQITPLLGAHNSLASQIPTMPISLGDEVSYPAQGYSISQLLQAATVRKLQGESLARGRNDRVRERRLRASEKRWHVPSFRQHPHLPAVRRLLVPLFQPLHT